MPSFNAYIVRNVLQPNENPYRNLMTLTDLLESLFGLMNIDMVIIHKNVSEPVACFTR